ncbi:MAG: TonB family protein [Cyclobacteriaceae bacterium]|jgi:TonB family protein|nr:TonB family protein [Flammeovirgaceae bacterium]
MKTRGIENFIRNTSLALFFIFLGLDVSAQKPALKFYDTDGMEVDSASSDYYEIITYSPKYELVSYTTKTGKIREKRVTTEPEGFLHSVMYYENGNKMCEGDINKNFGGGSVKSFYRDGFEKAELFYYSARASKLSIRVINYRDSLGNFLIENGSGMCNRCDLHVFSDRTYFETGKIVNGLKFGEWTGVNQTNDVTYSETYNEGILVNGTQNYKGQNYTYTELETQAMPPNGMQEIMSFIGEKMKYPKFARKNGIEGNVYIQFVIDRDGSIINPKVIKGIHPECDNEALNAVKSLPKWIPSYQRGRPVKQRFTIPIQFKLG